MPFSRKNGSRRHSKKVQSGRARRGGFRPRMEALEVRDMFAYTLSIGAASAITEGNSGTSLISFPVTLTGPGDGQPVTVNYRTLDGTATAGEDFVYKTGTLSFTTMGVSGTFTLPSGSGSSTGMLTVTVNGDTAVEANESFSVELLRPTANASITTSRADGTITNDDTTSSTNVGAQATPDKQNQPDQPENAPCDCACPTDGPSPQLDPSLATKGENSIDKKEGAVRVAGPAGDTHNSLVNPHPIVSTTFSMPTSGTLPDTVKAQLTLKQGANTYTQPAVYYGTSGLSLSQQVRLALMADATNLASGRYTTEVTITMYTGGTQVATQTVTSAYDLVNRTDSPFGRGRWLDELDQIVVASTGVLVIRGNNSAAWFTGTGPTFTSPDGSFGTLVISGGNYHLTYPDGTKTVFHPSGRLLASYDRDANDTLYTYTDTNADGKLELTSYVDGNNHTKTFAYSGGRLTSITDWAGRVTSYNINSTTNLLQSVTRPDPDGAGGLAAPVTNYSYYANGQLQTVDEPDGRSTTYVYDAARRISQVQHDDGSQWNLVSAKSQGVVDLSVTGYDTAHLAPSSYLTTTYESVETDELGNVTRTEMDKFGRPIKITNALGAVRTVSRDPNGSALKWTLPDPDGAGPLGVPVTTYDYDAKGNRAFTIFADGTTETLEYQAATGAVTKQIDQLGRVTNYTLDGWGNPWTITQIVGQVDSTGNGESDDLVWTNTFGTGGYLNNRLLTSTDPLGRVTKYEYFGTGAGIGSQSQLQKVTEAFGTIDASVTQWEYNVSGNLSAEIDPRLYRSEYVYDNLNRLTTVKSANPAQTGAATGPVTRYEYDGRDNVTKITDGLGRPTTYVYDGMNRVSQVQEPDVDGFGTWTTVNTGYAYDAKGNLASTTDPLGRVTSYEYNPFNRVTKITEPDPDGAGILTSPIYTYQYDAAGNLAADTDALGRKTTYAYDLMRRETLRTLADGAAYASEYDAIGNLTSETDALAAETIYAYDALDRVSKVTDAAGATTRYRYDRAGNLTSEVDAQGRATHFAYDNLNRQTRKILPVGELATTYYDRTIDDGDTGFAASAAMSARALSWAYGGDYRGNHSSGLTASDFATWTFSDVTAGKKYLVLVDWPPLGGASVPGATYKIYDNTTVVSTVVVNQNLPTGDITDSVGRDWKNLGTVTMASGTLKVELKLGTGPGWLAADAVRVVEIGAVQSMAYDASSNLTSATDGLGNVTTFAYDGLNRQIQKTNADPDGAGSLYTSPITKYHYDAVGNLTAIVDPRDGSTSGNRFYVTRYIYDNLNRLTQVVRPIDNAGYSPAPIIIDDGASGFTATGSWTTVSSSAGNDGDYRYTAPSAVKGATWSFTGLSTTKQYQIVATWPGDSTATTAAPFSISDGAALQGIIAVNQQVKPTDFTDDSGKTWKRLGIFTPTSGSFTVGVSANVAAGNVYADAVMLIEVGSVAKTVFDDASRVSSEVDPLGRTTSYTRDNIGRVTQLTAPDPDGAGGLTSPFSKYHYDANGNVTSVVDPLGNRTGYLYDKVGQVTHVISPLPSGTPIFNFVDDEDAPYFSTTGTWNAETVGALGDEFSSSDPAATATWDLYPVAVANRDYELLVRWDAVTGAAKDAVYEILSPTNVVLKTYTVNQQQTPGDLVDGSGISWRRLDAFRYDGSGMKIRLSSGAGGGTIIADAVQLQEVGPIRRTVYDATGRVTSELDPLGNATSYAYDAVGRLTQVTAPDPDGGGALAAPVTSYRYDVNGNRTSAIDPLGNRTGYIYDRWNRQTQVVQPLPTGTPLSYQVDDDPTYFSTTGTWSSGSLAGATGGDQYTSTDIAATAVWNLTALITANRTYEVLVNWQPDAAAQTDAVYELLNSSNTVLKTFTVNQQSVAADLVDENGVAWKRLDTLGYVSGGLKIRLRSGPAGGKLVADAVRLLEVNAPTKSTYDAADNLKTVTDPKGNVTTYAYDAMNRLSSETTTLGTRSYQYDPASNLSKAFDRLGRERRFGYDRLNRLGAEFWYTGTTLNRTLSFTFDLANQLTAATDSDAVAADYTYAYDNLGRMTSSIMTAAGMTPARKLENTYDANGNRNFLKATIGTTADFVNTSEFDRLNRLVNIDQTYQFGGYPVAEKRATFAYDADSRLTSLVRYSDLAGTQEVVTTTNTYDALSRITALDHSRGGSSIAGYGMTYDVGSRLTAFDFTNSAHNAEDVTTSYDRTAQLTSSDRAGTTSDETYGYDANGNRITGGFVVTTSNRYSQVVIEGVTWNLTYDAEGNLTQRTINGTSSSIQYVYDHRNRLIQIVGDSLNRGSYFASNPGTPGAQPIYAEFTYDMYDRRTTRTVDADGRSGGGFGGGAGVAVTDRFVYDGQDIVLQFDGTGAMTHRYLHGNEVDQVLADERFTPSTAGQMPSSAGTVLYPLTDQQNTTRDLVNSTGVVQNHLTYNSFGKITAETNAAVDYLFGYTGMERDEKLSIDRADHRYYFADIQRWLNEDPIDDDRNPYRYIRNSPTNGTDPSGLEPAFGITPETLQAMQNESLDRRIRAGGKVELRREMVGSGRGFGDAYILGGRDTGLPVWMRNLIAPPVQQSVRVYYDDGSSVLYLDGLPSNADMAGQASVLAPMMFGRAPKTCPTAPSSIATPRGPAIQATTPEAMSLLDSARSGAPLYRQGVTGVQNAADAQFWSFRNPASTPGYANGMGMPQITPPSGQYPWIMGGRVTPGAPIITRPAPGIGTNVGGNIEAVVNPGGVHAEWFYMP